MATDDCKTDPGKESLRNRVGILQDRMDREINNIIDLSRRLEDSLIQSMKPPEIEPMKEPAGPDGLLNRLVNWQERAVDRLEGIVAVLDRVVKEVEL